MIQEINMRSVALKMLRNKLTEYIRLAAGGETILVTIEDRVVAELGPPGARAESVAIGCIMARRLPPRLDYAPGFDRARITRAQTGDEN
jgi:antitoxin (DNA-binding transcriptional repressor) of toxin-antitoxin stability system